MPNPCFSYPALISPEIPSRVLAQTPSRDPLKNGYPCFGYPLTCYGYPADVPLGIQAGAHRMTTTACFRY